MSWLYYLLEANLYLILFYGFYRLLLQNETFYSLNRYFLLASTFISFVLPVFQLGFLKPSQYQYHGDMLYEIPPPPMEPPSSADISSSFAVINWLYLFYLLVAFFFALKLSFSIYKIIKIWLKAKKHTAGDITLVEVNGESTAFSFFNLLFIHPGLAHQPAVLKHEMVHIKQKHSFDVLFFELVQIISWFNPVLYFIKKDIKLLHEYIADELTTSTDMHKHEYALFLIQNSFGLRAQPITNQIFNQSILKRRINMLNKKRTASGARLRLLLVLPLTAAMLCASTLAFTKDYGYIDLLPEKSIAIAPFQEKPKAQGIKKEQSPKAKYATQAKTNQIKFPPPIVKEVPATTKPKVQNRYIVAYRTNRKTGKPFRVYNMYVVINGKPVENQDKFYGATNTESVTILSQQETKKRYGIEGVSGGVEITGSNINYLADIVPPPPVQDMVKFPPPIVKTVQRYFTPSLKQDKATGNFVGVDSRYIVVNGAPVEDNSKFLGITQAETVTYLSPAQATRVYGEEKGKYGAVEITGTNIEFNTQTDQIKFPPPIIKLDAPKTSPSPPNLKLKKAIPPPQVEPPSQNKKTQKFPPLIVKPEKVKAKYKMVEGDPLTEVRITGDPATSSKLNSEIKELTIKLLDTAKEKTKNKF